MNSLLQSAAENLSFILVCIGVSPIQLSLADFTADREFHPALKTHIHLHADYSTLPSSLQLFFDKSVFSV